MSETNEEYGFDPTQAIKLIIDNVDLQLALLKIPVFIIKSWNRINEVISWEKTPKFPGYYWIRDSNGSIGVAFIGPEAIPMKRQTDWEFAGPLIPPK